MLGPGERIDAWVAMNQPGVWIMGAPEDPVREGGLGIVIEYANQRRTPQWMPPPQVRLGLHDLRQAAVATGAHREAGHDLRKGAARRRQIQQLHGERQALSARAGVSAQAGHALPADVSQPHRRCASDAPASPPVRDRRNLRQSPPRASSRIRWWCPLMAAPAWTSPPTSRGRRYFTAISSTTWITASRRCCAILNRCAILSRRPILSTPDQSTFLNALPIPLPIFPAPFAVPTATLAPPFTAPPPTAAAASMGCSVARSTAPFAAPDAALPAPLATPVPMFPAPLPMSPPGLRFAFFFESSFCSFFDNSWSGVDCAHAENAKMTPMQTGSVRIAWLISAFILPLFENTIRCDVE